MMKKVIIIGAGAMGCLFAGKLAESGADVLLSEKDSGTIALINGQGVSIEDGSGTVKIKIRAASPAGAEGFDPELAIFLVKSYSTRVAAEDFAGTIGGAAVLTIQNGLGNVEELRAVFGSGRVYAGTTSHGATLVSPGKIRHAGTGDTIIGAPQADTTAAEIAALFSSAGIFTRVTNDIESVLWSKLVINAAINPLTAILDVENGALLESPPACALMEKAADEAAQIAAALGVRLDYDDAVAKVREVASLTGGNVSSMRQDIRAGRRTEIDAIGGAVVSAARAAGRDVPVIAALTELVKGIEKKFPS